MIGERLAHYRILEKLGEGGMGEVYLAEDTRLKRRIALKVLPRQQAAVDRSLERFQREAEAVAALNHPGIVTIHSVEEAARDSGERVRFLTMELVEGETLDRVVPKGGLPQKRLYDLTIQIAGALAAAHARGITHRDLKPSNVMVTAGDQVKVLDFGLAKVGDPGSEMTATHAPTEVITVEGTVLGTYPYMSPEQVEGKTLDWRTDIFSLGILLYEMATGIRPFRGDTSAALMSSILRDEVETVETVNPRLPRQLGRIIRHCLDKDPERRFQSALDLRNELAELRREVETEERGESNVAPPSRRLAAPARRGVQISVAALAALSVLALAWALWLRPAAEPPPPRALRTIAVLPFQNLGGDPDADYLRLAVPDEVTTALSRAGGLAVRPFATTAGLAVESSDPVAAGRAAQAASVVTGQYFVQGERLQLTMEAIDVEGNQVLWRDSVAGSVGDLISLRDAVAELVRQGLLPSLGARADQGGGTIPADEQAYALYLRALAQGLDVEPNLRAIEMFEQALELDPTYAPAWSELSRRYYLEANYGQAGRPMYEAAIRSAEQALALDPLMVRAAVQKVTIGAELGSLERSWDAAVELVARHPESAEAHHAMGYVLRYAGLLEEALESCERALALDPTNPRFRSCGLTAYFIGAFDRAEHFLRLDGSSQAFYDNLALLRLRQGRPDEALALLRSDLRQHGLDPAVGSYRRHLVLCLAGAPREELRPVAETVERNTRVFMDGEQYYWSAAHLSYCGEADIALGLLRTAVARGYCAFPLIERDPLLAPVRAAAGYEGLRASARACSERFLAHRAGAR